jgi:hypothetical protein
MHSPTLMFHGVEARAPTWDVNFVMTAHKLAPIAISPRSCKIFGKMGCYRLRESFR